ARAPRLEALRIQRLRSCRPCGRCDMSVAVGRSGWRAGWRAGWQSSWQSSWQSPYRSPWPSPEPRRSRSATDYCGACRMVVRGIRPPLLVRLEFWAMLASIVALLGSAALFFWFILLGLPLFGLLGMGLGPLAARAFAEPLCPHCGRLVARCP